MDTNNIFRELLPLCPTILEKGIEVLTQYGQVNLVLEGGKKLAELEQQLRAAKIHVWEYEDTLHKKKKLEADIPLPGLPSGTTLYIGDVTINSKSVPGDYDINLHLLDGERAISPWTLGESITH